MDIIGSCGRARARAREPSPVSTYLLRVFIISAIGIFIVTTLKRADRAQPRPSPVMDTDTLERSQSPEIARTSGNNVIYEQIVSLPSRFRSPVRNGKERNAPVATCLHNGCRKNRCRFTVILPQILPCRSQPSGEVILFPWYHYYEHCHLELSDR